VVGDEVGDAVGSFYAAADDEGGGVPGRLAVPLPFAVPVSNAQREPPLTRSAGNHRHPRLVRSGTDCHALVLVPLMPDRHRRWKPSGGPRSALETLARAERESARTFHAQVRDDISAERARAEVPRKHLLTHQGGRPGGTGGVRAVGCSVNP
jgi:hypothetical protein